MTKKKGKMVSDYERAAWCALSKVFGYEPATGAAISSELGSASAVFELSEKERDSLFGPFSKFKGQITPSLLEKSYSELEKLSRDGCRFICRADEGYPEILKECEDAPLGLYYKGVSEPGDVFGVKRKVAIVGTRDISPYGSDSCRSIVRALSETRHKPLIVSGFALGTDIIAHSTALECSLPTVAVLPTGIDEVYPRRHWGWAKKLASTPHCALVTDYPPGTGAVAVNFLRRNRIIAGLAEATIVIESKARGGGLITAEFAFNYDREVYAVPGRVEDIRSAGCNNLIKKRIADPVTSIPTLVADLGLGRRGRFGTATPTADLGSLYSSLPEDELERLMAVARCIKECRGITAEDIALKLGNCSVGEAGRIVSMLEADGIVATDLLQRCSLRVRIV